MAGNMKQDDSKKASAKNKNAKEVKKKTSEKNEKSETLLNNESKEVASKPAKKLPWRPSKYKPEFCHLVIELGKLGQTTSDFAFACKVDSSTIREWAKVHPDFSLAFKYAKTCSAHWWLKKSRDNLENKEFNAHLYAFASKNHCPDECAEMRETFEELRLRCKTEQEKRELEVEGIRKDNALKDKALNENSTSLRSEIAEKLKGEVVLGLGRVMERLSTDA